VTTIWTDNSTHRSFSRVMRTDLPASLQALLSVTPDKPKAPHPAYQMDIYMMLLLGARERKLSESSRCSHKAAFVLTV
jgi:hypothetical protein